MAGTSAKHCTQNLGTPRHSRCAGGFGCAARSDMTLTCTACFVHVAIGASSWTRGCSCHDVRCDMIWSEHRTYMLPAFHQRPVPAGGCCPRRPLDAEERPAALPFCWRLGCTRQPPCTAICAGLAPASCRSFLKKKSEHLKPCILRTPLQQGRSCPSETLVSAQAQMPRDDLA